MASNPVWEICERMAEVQALLHDHVECGKHSAADVVAKAQAVLSESELLGRCSMSATSRRTRRRVSEAGGSYAPCVDGSELARTFFTLAELVGAPVCSAFKCGSHDRWP